MTQRHKRDRLRLALDVLLHPAWRFGEAHSHQTLIRDLGRQKGKTEDSYAKRSRD